MVQKQRSDYLSLRRAFEPMAATLVIVAELPPISGKYFYDPDGKVKTGSMCSTRAELFIFPPPGTSAILIGSFVKSCRKHFAARGFNPEFFELSRHKRYPATRSQGGPGILGPRYHVYPSSLPSLKYGS